jgi:ferredoxin
LNYGDCVGCGLCMIGCPAYEDIGSEAHTAKGRNRMLQAGLKAADMVEAIDACTLCGYCDAVCPKHVRNVEITLKLRRDLNGASSLSAPAARPLVLGCTLRDKAPRLIPSIVAFLKKIGRPAEPEAAGCCGSWDVEAGKATRTRVKADVVCDPVCLEQYDADFLGALAMKRLDLFDLKPPFYYFAPHRLINGFHDEYYPIYHGLREKTGCEMNLDLNRLARSTTASAVNPKDVGAAVKRLLRHSKANRIITCSPAEYLAFKEHSGRETLFITECLR